MLSIVIPFKYDSNHRLENLLELLKYIKKYWEFDQIIISEMDFSPKIINLIPSWVDYVFAKESASSVWSRSKRVNLCTTLIKNEVMAILDTDVVVDKSCVSLSVQKIIKNEIDAVTPFEKVYHFPRSLVLEEMKKNEISIDSFCKNEKFSRSFVANGGCFITKTSIFKHIRGMNELFIGWGLEDDELITRYLKLGYRYGRISSMSAIHINHERTKSCEIDLENFNNSLIEKNRLLLLNKEQILDYFGITKEPGIYCGLKTPLPPDNRELIELVDKEKEAYKKINQEPYEI